MSAPVWAYLSPMGGALLIERGDRVTVGDVIGMALAWFLPPVGLVVCWLAVRQTKAWSSRRSLLVAGLGVALWWTSALVGIALSFLGLGGGGISESWG